MRCALQRSAPPHARAGASHSVRPRNPEQPLERSVLRPPFQATALLGAHRDPSATHNCFAYKLGDQFRSSDDGEPGGTAGRPILSAIEGEGLDGVCVLVVR